MSDNKISFETDMQALQNIVQKLEQGETSLDESLASFEEGMLLLKRCRQQLVATETKVQEITAAHADQTMEEES